MMPGRNEETEFFNLFSDIDVQLEWNSSWINLYASWMGLNIFCENTTHLLSVSHLHNLDILDPSANG